ncbi:MAG: DNA repair protein RecN [Selenomonadaceae bacterium]|nr:DNA repair protein RecN [Selenomonadaceae bacterium]
MLKTLTVENFALIENITVEFGAGLNILTGETGAGKSILIDALGTILGNRAGVNQIRKGADYLRVSATFNTDGELLTIERKISRKAKNSVTVNGKAMTLSALKKLGANLVDVHGQNTNLALLRTENIYKLIDDEKISEVLERYQRLYREQTAQAKILDEKNRTRLESLQRLDFLRWQEKEISAARLKPNEDVKLDAEIKKLSHAEKIAENIQGSAHILNDSDEDILTGVARVSKNLAEVARYDDKLNSARKLLDEAEILLREVYEEIRDYNDGLEFSPERLNKLQERADVIFKLKQKYGGTVEEILKRLTAIKKEISATENFESDVAELQRTVTDLERQARISAHELFLLRQASAKSLSTLIEREVRRLGMEQAQFEIEVTETERLTANGADTADILFCANVGEEMLSLSKVVSGGELSRVALAVKTVSAGRENSAPTMIFDEIDTGLGGVTAKIVAECIAKVARNRQVLCVTHLAQIASMADVHLQISKSEIDGRTITKVNPLDESERIKEISRMASGEESLVSLKNARQMISSAAKIKSLAS